MAKAPTALGGDCAQRGILLPGLDLTVFPERLRVAKSFWLAPWQELRRAGSAKSSGGVGGLTKCIYFRSFLTC